MVVLPLVPVTPTTEHAPGRVAVERGGERGHRGAGVGHDAAGGRRGRAAARRAGPTAPAGDGGRRRGRGRRARRRGRSRRARRGRRRGSRGRRRATSTPSRVPEAARLRRATAARASARTHGRRPRLARAAPWWSVVEESTPAGGTRRRRSSAGRSCPTALGPDPAVGARPTAAADRGAAVGLHGGAVLGEVGRPPAGCRGGGSANEAILEKAGAATAPPVYLPPCGSSIITMTESAGCSAGTKPTKVDWYWVMPYSSV